MKKNRYYVLAIIFIFCFFFQGLLSLIQKSPTYDESIIIVSGSSYLKFSNNKINSENPPFLKGLYASPTWFLDLNMSYEKPLEYSYSMASEFAWAQKILYEKNKKQTDKIVFYSRLTALIFICILLFFMFFMIQHLWGIFPAIITLFLFCFSPNFIAHARLTTPDAGFASLLFCYSLCLHRALKNEGVKFWLLAGLFAGCAMAGKFTGILILPIFILQISYAFFITENREMKKNLLLKSILIPLICLLFLAFLYDFKGSFNSINHLASIQSPLLLKLQNLPLLGYLPLPIPYDYLQGFDIVAFNNKPGLPNYFLGTLYPEGGRWWYYYIVNLAYKLPLSLILLIFLCLYFFKKEKYDFKYAIIFFFPAFVIMFNFSFIAYRQLGLRYILPIFPYLFLGLALILARQLKPQKKFFKPIIFVFALYAMNSLLTFPDYLPHFNMLAGGQEQSSKLFISSNNDWGQDLKGLGEWQKKNHIPVIGLFYHGTALPSHYGNFKNFQSLPYEYLAISVSEMALNPDYALIKAAKKVRPIQIIGNTIKVYKIEDIVKAGY